MENLTDSCRDILHEFLNRWTVDKVKQMALDQYVSVGNPDTFCQWVETKTADLGNIKGPVGSIKFGIYKRTDKNKKPRVYDNDEEYSWQKSFSANTRKEAFEMVKSEIIKIIEYANVGSLKRLITQNSMTFSNGKLLSCIHKKESSRFSAVIIYGELRNVFN